MERKFIKNYKKWYFLIPLWLFVFDFILVKTGMIQPIDDFIYHLIQPLICQPCTLFFKLMSFLGSGLFYVIVIVIIMIMYLRKGLIFGLHLCMIQILNRIIKAIVQRPRPDMIYHLVQETNYSFPSGHAMSAMIGYLLLIHYVKQTDYRWKKYMIILLECIIFLIGLSRIYLGVHYFSDVIGGYLLSLSYYLFIRHNTSLHT